MLRALSEILRNLIEPQTPGEAPPGEHALQLATAVLLVEVMRADTGTAPEERATVLGALRDKFELSDDELARLLELAEAESDEASDFYRFTSQINKGFDIGQKVRIVEALWRVALADGHISPHENHLMRKLGELLHIPHADYVAAKQRARDHDTRP